MPGCQTTAGCKCGDTWGASMIAYPPVTPESRAREALKFVRVSTNNGYLTDISISMLLVELKRSGVTLSLSCRE